LQAALRYQLAYRLLLRQLLSVVGFLQFLFFFLKKVAQVAIGGNKTEPKMAINSDKTENKIIHRNLLTF